jgi:CRP/FNR family nitrogen fixation transcriptional regulator
VVRRKQNPQASFSNQLFIDPCDQSDEARVGKHANWTPERNLGGTRLRVISRSTLAVRADRDPAIGGELLALTARELKRAQERALLLAKTAQERVASFLVEMAERGAGGNAIDLPMSRQDIADYLGMSVETVSRTLASLEKNSTIRVRIRRIVLRDWSALEGVSSPH